MASKYQGMKIDYRREVVGIKYIKDHTYYILKNIYNNQEIEIHNTTFRKIIKGETTVDNIIRIRIKKKENNYKKNYTFRSVPK